MRRHARYQASCAPQAHQEPPSPLPSDAAWSGRRICNPGVAQFGRLVYDGNHEVAYVHCEQHRSHREAGPAARAARACVEGDRRRRGVRRLVRREVRRALQGGRAPARRAGRDHRRRQRGEDAAGLQGRPVRDHDRPDRAERIFAFRWHPFAIERGVDYSAEPTTLITFALEEVPNGTLLTVTESGFDRIPLERRAKAFAANEGGWTIQMTLIEKYLANNA